ncbi:serine hydrolase [Chlorobium sp. KB01]|uniref:serine hydrolase domain-containing protein n=1 Tax=Chlorobium sp. KB01 TaxID=1917528 RepID=UPI0009768EB2|nr:serine hydrolase domain-containing protein [Chlorobium sp. KB01]
MPSLRIVFIFCCALAGSLQTTPARAQAFNFKPLEAVMGQAVSDSVFPGASLAVLYKGKVVFHKAFGKKSYAPESTPVDTTTIYDLASLTKAISTTSIIMQLVERDSLSLQAPVAKYLPAFGSNGKDKVTIEHLLRHTSGLRAHSYFAKSCRSPEELFNTIENDSLLSPPGRTTLYSDPGFMLLGKIVATITGHNLAENFHARFAAPLGMHATMFTPPATLLQHIAPAGQDGDWPFNTVRPLVHDQNAALLGGVAGHAGLYSTTGDLITFTGMLMHGGTSGRRVYFRKETLRNFLSRSSAERALGWDLRSIDGPSSAGDYFSTSSYGHLGYTGTSIWIDPQQDLAVILLSNRVWPTSANIKIRKFRPLLHNTVAECLQLKRL